VAAGAGRGRAVALAPERLADRADDKAAHQPRIAETHVGFRRVHIDIHQGWIDLDGKHRDRVAPVRDGFRIGRPQRRPEKLVLHGPAVDEGELVQAVAAVEGRHAGKARQPHALPFRVDLDGIVAEIPAEHLRDAREAIRPGRGKFQRRPVGAR